MSLFISTTQQNHSVKQWLNIKIRVNCNMTDVSSYSTSTLTTHMQTHTFVRAPPHPHTCGILPSPAPPPTATMGSPVCADTNSSMGARGPQAVRGGLSSSYTRPCRGRAASSSHSWDSTVFGLLSFTWRGGGKTQGHRQRCEIRFDKCSGVTLCYPYVVSVTRLTNNKLWLKRKRGCGSFSRAHTTAAVCCPFSSNNGSRYE